MPIGEMIGEFLTSPGPGGLIVGAAIVLAAGTYIYLTRWILKGGEGERPPRGRRSRITRRD